MVWLLIIPEAGVANETEETPVVTEVRLASVTERPEREGRDCCGVRMGVDRLGGSG